MAEANPFDQFDTPAANPFDQFDAPAAPTSTLDSVLNNLKALPRGAAKGLGNFASLLGRGTQPEAALAGIDPFQMSQASGAATDKAVSGAIDTVQNKTGALPDMGDKGTYGNAVGETLGNPLSYVGPGGFAAKLLTGTGASLGSEAAGKLAAGTKFEPFAKLIGAIGGGMTPAAAGRAITPLPINATRQALADTMENEGVKLTAGQKTGRPWLRYWENDLAPGTNEKQGEQFTTAALRRVGENSPRATPEVVDGAFKRIGGDFDRLSANNNVLADTKLGNDLVNTWRNYASLVPPTQRAPIVENTIRELGDAFANNQGTLQGPAYQSLRSRLAAAARGSKDVQLSHALSDMTEALDDGMERSIRTTNPTDAGGFQRARRQYRNMLVIERAAAGAGEDAAQGLISPALLSSSAKQVMGKRAYVRGQGDFAPLARGGQAFLKPLPDSGTSQRNRINNLIRLAGGATGAIVGNHVGGAENSVLGLLAGEIAAEPLIRMGAKGAVMGPMQRYLANQALPKVPGLFATAPLQALTASAPN